MTRNTAKHDWTVPTAGDNDYEITFNELFTDFDTDIEVRDEEQFLSSYDPDLNAKFVATDTGNIYLGDGNSWNQYPVQPEAEAVEDVVGGLLNGGTNVSLNYDDASNVLTINTSALNQEEVEDAVASLVTAGNAITVNYDDNADALSIGVNESALSFYDGTNLTADIDATNGTFNSFSTVNGDISSSPSTGTDIANKDYVDSVAQGLDWQDSVIGEQNTPPTSPSAGDRYLIGASPTDAWGTHGRELTEYVNGAWKFYIPSEGTATFVENADVLNVYQNGSWIPFGSAINHSSLTGLGNDDHTQYVLVDGTRAMTGGLDMGTNSITNANSITSNSVNTEDLSRTNVGVSGFLSSDQSISSDTPTRVAFDSVRDDDQSEFDTGSNTFTAADAGDYAVVAQVETKSGNIGDFLRLAIMVNGSKERRGQYSNSGGPGSEVRVIAHKLGLSAGDTVSFRYENTTSSDILSGVSDRSYFDIIQVG